MPTKISSLLTIGICYFLIFDGFWEAPIFMWDEATYANNALDMAYHRDNPLVIKHMGQADSYNTKPPLVIWLQAACIHLFGIGEFAIRLPSVLFGFFTVCLVYIFVYTFSRRHFVALASCCILLSSGGYNRVHVLRSGDLDAILVFFLTLGLFSYLYLIIRQPIKQGRLYFIIGLSIVLGFLSKGIAGLFFVPFMIVIGYLYNRTSILGDKNLFYTIGAALIPISIYYLLRECYQPGYWNLVWRSEISRISKPVMTWHIRPTSFYIDNMMAFQYEKFFFTLPLAMLIILFVTSPIRTLSFYLWIVVVGYLALISYPPVKLEWYDAPLYPLLAVIIAVSLFTLHQFIISKVHNIFNQEVMSNLLKVICSSYLIFCLISTYRVNKYIDSNIYEMEFDGAYLRHLYSVGFPLNDLIVFKKERSVEHYDQVLFYVRSYNRRNNLGISLQKEQLFDTNDVVMCTNKELQDVISSNCDVEVIHQWGEGRVYRIL